MTPSSYINRQCIHRHKLANISVTYSGCTQSIHTGTSWSTFQSHILGVHNQYTQAQAGQHFSHILWVYTINTHRHKLVNISYTLGVHNQYTQAQAGQHFSHIFWVYTINTHRHKLANISVTYSGCTQSIHTGTSWPTFQSYTLGVHNQYTQAQAGQHFSHIFWVYTINTHRHKLVNISVTYSGCTQSIHTGTNISVTYFGCA